MSREDKVAVVEAYLRGLAGKDISAVPFAGDVTFEGPRVPPLAGRQAVSGFLTMILPAIQNIRIKQHIVEGDYVATVSTWKRWMESIGSLIEYACLTVN